MAEHKRRFGVAWF